MNTIDLDLVELRCNLRNWKCNRIENRGYNLNSYADITTPHGYRQIWTNMEYPASDPIAGTLTRPRLTIANLTTNPGNGWVMYRMSEITVDFHFTDGGDRALATVSMTYGALPPERRWRKTWVRDGLDYATEIKAHQALVDILIRLAEVK